MPGRWLGQMPFAHCQTHVKHTVNIRTLLDMFKVDKATLHIGFEQFGLDFLAHTQGFQIVVESEHLMGLAVSFLKRWLTRGEARWSLSSPTACFRNPRMNPHGNASLTPKVRAHLVSRIALIGLILVASGNAASPLKTHRFDGSQFASCP